MEKKRIGKNHYAWRILLGCCMLQLMTLGAIVNAGGIYYVDIVADFHARGQALSVSDLSLFYTALSLAVVVGLSFASKLLERFPLRSVMAVGLLVMAGAQGAMAFYDDALLWGVSGFLVGVTAPLVGIVSPTLMLMNWFHKKKGTALALQSAAGSIGGAIMSPVTEALIQQVGWRATYLIIAGGVILLVLPFILFVFRLTPEEIGWQAFGSEEEAEAVRPEAGAEEAPGITAQLAKRTPAFWLIVLSMSCTGFLYSFVQILKVYAASQNWEAFGAPMTSLALLGSLGGSLLAGLLSDRLGLAKVYGGGALAVALGLALLLAGRSNPYLLLAGSALFGIIQGLGMVGAPLLIRKSFGTKDYGTLFSQLLRVQFFASALAYFTVTRLAETFGTPLQPDYLPLLAVGVGLSLTLGVAVPLALRKPPL